MEKLVFVTSAAPGYRKPWIFDSLSKLTHRTVCLLHPSDDRRLPPNAERANFTGDRYYQDGRFMDAVTGVSEDDAVVLVDCDAVFQRDADPAELDPGDGFALGWNRIPGQPAHDEYAAMQPRVPLHEAAKKLGVNFGNMHSAPVYNWGLASAKPATWRRLRRWYAEHAEYTAPSLFGNPCYMQMVMCVGLAELRIPVRTLDESVHLHWHYPPWDQRRRIADNKAYLGEKLALYAHNVREAAGPWPQWLLSQHRFDSCGMEFNYARGLADLLLFTRPKSVLEFGGWLGVSTEVFARFAERVTCVDDQCMPQLQERCAGFGNVTLVKGRVPEALDVLEEQSYDLVYCDTEHTAVDVERDVAAARRFVKPGGWICGHDFGQPYTHEVAPTVRKLLGEPTVFQDSSWAVRALAAAG